MKDKTVSLKNFEEYSERSFDIYNFEKIINGLKELGLNDNEAKIFLFLCKSGPLKAKEITEALGINRSEIYNILASLQSKGLVIGTLSKPIKFMSIDFDKALDLLLQNYKIKVKKAEDIAGNLLNIWKSFSKSKPNYEIINDEEAEKFQILTGTFQTFSKTLQLVKNSQSTFYGVLSVKEILSLDYLVNFQSELLELNKRGIKPKLILKSAFTDEIISGLVEIKKIDYDLPTFFLSDRRELLVFLSCDKMKDVRALWSNCSSIVKTFLLLCETILAA